MPYQAGDPKPEGYLNWHAWARAQRRGGLRQSRCPRCRLWRFPQEMSGEDVEGNLICTVCNFEDR